VGSGPRSRTSLYCCTTLVYRRHTSGCYMCQHVQKGHEVTPLAATRPCGRVQRPRWPRADRSGKSPFIVARRHVAAHPHECAVSRPSRRATRRAIRRGRAGRASAATRFPSPGLRWLGAGAGAAVDAPRGPRAHLVSSGCSPPGTRRWPLPASTMSPPCCTTRAVPQSSSMTTVCRLMTHMRMDSTGLHQSV